MKIVLIEARSNAYGIEIAYERTRLSKGEKPVLRAYRSGSLVCERPVVASSTPTFDGDVAWHERANVAMSGPEIWHVLAQLDAGLRILRDGCGLEESP